MRRILGLIYIVVGVVVAMRKDYFESIDAFDAVVSALLAILLWPLLLLGIDLNVRL